MKGQNEEGSLKWRVWGKGGGLHPVMLSGGRGVSGSIFCCSSPQDYEESPSLPPGGKGGGSFL